MQQEVKDWQNHPLTKNWFVAADEIIREINEELNTREINIDTHRRAYLIGVMEGLESLQTYDPVIDEVTGEVVDV